MRNITAGIVLTALLAAHGIAKEKECICFELEGKFGEEIKAILMKYAKNLGDEDIKIIKEQGTPEQQSFVNSLLGVGSADLGDSGDASDPESMKEFYNSSCASCHGEQGDEMLGGMGKPLHAYSADEISEAIRSYQDGDYQGSARFVKQSVTQPLVKREVRSLARYIEQLKK